jgi:hypothetical protein
MCKPGCGSASEAATKAKTTATYSSSSLSTPPKSTWWLVHAWNVIVSKYQTGQFSWVLIIYLTFVHIVAIIGLFAVPYCQDKTILFAFILWPITYVFASVLLLFRLVGCLVGWLLCHL